MCGTRCSLPVAASFAAYTRACKRYLRQHLISRIACSTSPFHRYAATPGRVYHSRHLNSLPCGGTRMFDCAKGERNQKGLWIDAIFITQELLGKVVRSLVVYRRSKFEMLLNFQINRIKKSVFTGVREDLGDADHCRFWFLSLTRGGLEQGWIKNDLE